MRSSAKLALLDSEERRVWSGESVSDRHPAIGPDKIAASKLSSAPRPATISSATWWSRKSPYGLFPTSRYRRFRRLTSKTILEMDRSTVCQHLFGYRHCERCLQRAKVTELGRAGAVESDQCQRDARSADSRNLYRRGADPSSFLSKMISIRRTSWRNVRYALSLIHI